jgi:hypothetical protein
MPRVGAGAAISDADTIGLTNHPPDVYVVGGSNGKMISDSMYFAPAGLDTTDTTPPVVTQPPAPRVPVGVQAGTTTFPVAIRWTGSDAETDILADNLQTSSDGATWVDVTVPWAVLDPAQFAFGTTGRAQYRVTPTDCGGNADPTPTAGMPFSTHLYSERAINYKGTWSSAASSSAQGGRYRYSTKKGAIAKFRFTGRDIAWLAAKGPTSGSAIVSINGVRVATVDLHAKTEEPRMVVFQHSFATQATRTLTIKVVGTARHPSVNIDSLFEIGNPIAAAAIHADAAISREATHATAAPPRRVARAR